MKITCGQCQAQYDVADSQIPADGYEMPCLACGNMMIVGGASQGIALSLDDDADLPTHKPASARRPPPAVSEAALAEPDFSSLGDRTTVGSDKGGMPSSPDLLELVPVVEESDLPTPKVRSAGPAAIPLAEDAGADLPAPKARGAALSAPPDAGVDLPAPRVARPPIPVAKPPAAPPPAAAKPPAPPARPPVPPPPPPVLGVAHKADLPQPKKSGEKSSVDLPQPKRAPISIAEIALSELPLPESMSGPAAPSGTNPNFDVPIDLEAPDLDTPDIDDTIGLSDDIAEPPGLRSDIPDLPAARGHSTSGAPVDSLETLLEGADPAAPSKSGAAIPAAKAAAPAKPPLSRKKKIIIAGAGVAVLAVAGGAVVMLGLVGGGTKEVDAKVASAHTAIFDGTLASFRRAVSELKPYTSGDKPNANALSVEAQAHLLEGRLGLASEIAAGKALVEKPVEGPPTIEHQRAEGLAALASGDIVNSKKTLKEILEKTPGDAASLTYLGLAEMAGRDASSAAGSFGRALSALPKNALASYGLGLAKERLGDDKAARAAYAKVLTMVPTHMRARLGILRIDARGGDATAAAKIEALIAENASALAPRENAEGQVAMGQTALDLGRAADAEEHFKKAVALDPDPALSHVAFDAKLGLCRARLLADHSAEAIEALPKLVALDPRGVDARLLLAEALINKQEVTEAEALLVAVEALRPKDARLALLRARIILSRSTATKADKEEAVTKLREATTADPKLLAAWATLARTLNDLGRTPEALEALSKAADGLTGDPRGAALIGAAYLAIGKPAEAEARFRTVVDADVGKPPNPEHVPVWIGLGEALEAQNKLDDAKQVYADAQKIAPGSAMLFERRARLAVTQGANDEARGLYDEALKIGTPTAAVRLGAAFLALNTGRAPDARSLAEAVIKDDERSALANLVLARVELEAGHVEEAISMARRCVNLADLPEGHLVLAQGLEQSGNLDAAAAEFALARKPPTTDRAIVGRARVLDRKGATKDALTELAALSKTTPLRAEALMIEGECYADLQQRDKARKAFEEASKFKPPLPEAIFKYGGALLDVGKNKEAIEPLERAISLAPPKTAWLPDAYMQLGDAYKDIKKSEPAVKAYRKYLELAPPDAAKRSEAEEHIQMLGGAPIAPPAQ